MPLFADALTSIADAIDRLPGRSKLSGFLPGETVTAQKDAWTVKNVGAKKVHCQRELHGQTERRSFLPGQLRKGSLADQFRAAADASRDPRDRMRDAIEKGRLPPGTFR